MLERETLYLRISPKLKEQLSQAAKESRKTLNSFCVEILESKKYIKLVVAQEKSNREVIKLFAAMGNNLNQLARHCNATGESARPEQLLKILDEAKKMQREILQAIKEQRNGDI